MVDSLCDQAGGQNIAVACFHSDSTAQREQSSTSILGALLKQLVVGLGEVPGEITRAYEEQKNFIGGRRPRHTDIVKMLPTASSGKRTFICVDALDECVPERRVKLLGSLSQILQKTPATKVFVIGRPHIRPEIGRRFSGRVTNLSVSTKTDDIIRYIRSGLEEATTPNAMRRFRNVCRNNGTREATSRMRWPVHIQILGSLVECRCRPARNHNPSQATKLSAMANGLGLGDAYDATLGRIREKGEKARPDMTALMWISHSERPLKTDELHHALAVDVGSLNLNTDNVPSIGTC